MTKIICDKATKNKYFTYGDYTIGVTSSGMLFIIDTEDIDLVKNYSWHNDGRGYLVAYINDSRKEHIALHRLILSPDDDEYVDHINHDKVDNRKCNLRIVTRSQNNINRRTPKSNTSGVKGVKYAKYNRQKKWVAQLTINNCRHVKSFYTKEEAIKQRKEWEEKYFKEYNYKENEE